MSVILFFSMKEKSHVFVVDDDPSARKGLSRLLRTAGHDVCDFASLRKFLDTICSQPVSGCLLLDLRMPEPLDEEIRAKLLADQANLSIIVITGDDNSTSRKEAEKLKAVGFFRKPVDGIALLDAIKWIMREE